MFVPDTVLETQSGWREALESNQQVITSPSDMHETMIHLAGGRGAGDTDWWKEHGYDTHVRGASLLNPLPYNRNCTDAGIPQTECVCGGAPMNEIKEGSPQWTLVETNFLSKIVNQMNVELANHNLTTNVCRSLKVGALLYASFHEITPKIAGYHTRFSIVSPRSEPMEMLAVFGIGKMEMRSHGAMIDTIIQTSRFHHWQVQCEAAVTASGGNHHYCDCVNAPEGGWDLNVSRSRH